MTGHAGCSVSTALGLKSGDDLRGEGQRRSVAVIGDGAFPSGIVFEALNNAGELNADMLVVLNDNKIVSARASVPWLVTSIACAPIHSIPASSPKCQDAQSRTTVRRSG